MESREAISAGWGACAVAGRAAEARAPHPVQAVSPFAASRRRRHGGVRSSGSVLVLRREGPHPVPASERLDSPDPGVTM